MSRIRWWVMRSACSSGPTVDDSTEQELLGVGAIAGEEDAVIAVLDDDPDMARAVAGQRLFG